MFGILRVKLFFKILMASCLSAVTLQKYITELTVEFRNISVPDHIRYALKFILPIRIKTGKSVKGTKRTKKDITTMTEDIACFTSRCARRLFLFSSPPTSLGLTSERESLRMTRYIRMYAKLVKMRNIAKNPIATYFIIKYSLKIQATTPENCIEPPPSTNITILRFVTDVL